MVGNCFSPSTRFSQIDSRTNILSIILPSTISLIFLTSSTPTHIPAPHSILYVALKPHLYCQSNVSGRAAVYQTYSHPNFVSHPIALRHSSSNIRWDECASMCVFLGVCIISSGMFAPCSSAWKTSNVWNCAHHVLVCAWICVCMVVLFCVCISVGRGGPPAEETDPQGVSLAVASPPLPPHLTNYCATSTPLMKPGTCPSV